MRPNRAIRSGRVLLLWVCSALWANAEGLGPVHSGAAASKFTGTLTVLTTNDRHSHCLVDPYDPAQPTALSSTSVGGLARMATVFDRTRALAKDVLVFDAGDFVDGTAFINAENGAADLNLLSSLGYDAACLGNHEMAFGPVGLVRMIRNARRGPDGRIVPLLCANIRFGSDASALQALYGKEGEPGKAIFPYIVRTTASGLKVGIFGLIGQQVFMPDAAPCTFPVVYPEIQHLVDRLRHEEKVDAVICLAHASFSTSGEVPKGELVELARAVAGIDLICAGHSHVQAVARVACAIPQAASTTTLLEAGSNARLVGRADLHFLRGRPAPEGTTTEIVALDGSLPGKPEIVAKIAGYIADIEDNYLTRFPRLKDGRLFAPLAHAPFSWGDLNSMNLVTDAMRTVAATDVALCTSGGDTARVQRDSAGNITVYEAFAAMPHSEGRDGLHGGALYRFHLLAAEVRGLLELGTCNSSHGDGDLFVVPAGVRIVYTTADLTTGKGRGHLLKMALVDPDERTQTLIYDITDPRGFPYGGWKTKPGTTGQPGDPQQLLSVSSSQLTLVGLKAVTTADPRAGIDLWPRDQTGAQVRWNRIEETDRFVVRHEGQEVKAWIAVARYVEAFGGTVPLRYDDEFTDGRTHNPIGPPWRRVWDIAVHPRP